jgi:hypothetical protein
VAKFSASILVFFSTLFAMATAMASDMICEGRAANGKGPLSAEIRAEIHSGVFALSHVDARYLKWGQPVVRAYRQEKILPKSGTFSLGKGNPNPEDSLRLRLTLKSDTEAVGELMFKRLQSELPLIPIRCQIIPGPSIREKNELCAPRINEAVKIFANSYAKDAKMNDEEGAISVLDGEGNSFGFEELYSGVFSANIKFKETCTRDLKVLTRLQDDLKKGMECVVQSVEFDGEAECD